jgi:hypothetical protein
VIAPHSNPRQTVCQLRGLRVLAQAFLILGVFATGAFSFQSAHALQKRHSKKSKHSKAKKKPAPSEFASVLPRHESTERKKEHREQLANVSVLQDDQKKFPRLQMLDDSDLEFVFVLPPQKSKAAREPDTAASAAAITTAEVKAKKINLEKLQISATENFFKKLVSAGGTGLQVKKTEFGDEIKSMSVDPTVLDTNYTLSLLTFPPIFEGIKNDLGIKTLLIAPALEKQILLAEDTPINRKLLREAIDKLHIQNRDKRDWASSKVYQFTGGKNFTAL